MEPLLRVQGLTKNFGGLTAVMDLEFDLPQDSILGLVGPNGSGKTTTFNLIAGLLKPDEGEILFKGENIVGLKPWQVCKRGVARTFQIPQSFNNLTVLESVMLGNLFGHKRGFDMKEAKSRALETIDFLGLTSKKNQLCDSLTLVDQRKTEIARALATSPELLLMDESIAGLNPTETQELLGVVQEIKGSGVTIIFIEHVISAVAEVSDKILVMDYGRKIAWDKPAQVFSNKEVIEAYLGTKRKKHAKN
jgi:branched-chain amino acid transport system ATP-binding protein